MKRAVDIVLILIATAGLLWLLRGASSGTAFTAATDTSDEAPRPETARAAPQAASSGAPGPRNTTPAPDEPSPAREPSQGPPTGKTDIALPTRDTANDRAPADLARRYSAGTRWQTENGEFQVLTLRAIAKADYDTELGPVVFEKDGRVFFEGGRADAGKAILDGRSLPTVARTANGRVGFLSGTLLVTLKDRHAVDGVAASHGLQVKAFDEELRLAYLAIAAPGSILDAVESLKNDASVEAVKPEVILSFKRF